MHRFEAACGSLSFPKKYTFLFFISVAKCSNIVKWYCMQGVQAHPQNFWFVENPGKVPENLDKISENSNKITENLGKNGAQRCLTSKNCAQGLQKNKCRPFLEVTPWKRSANVARQLFGQFGKIRAKILCPSKNLLARTPMS